MAAEEFVPPGQPESTKSCGGNITGSKKTNLNLFHTQQQMTLIILMMHVVD